MPTGPVPDASGPSMGPQPELSLARGEQPTIDLEERRSHFLAVAARTDDEEEARAFIAAQRAAYPDARHHCSAFTVPVAGARSIERSSDDGEPSGTAGQPILEVLRGTELTRTTVVVTRYFGGTLLGTGGLVRAYSEAASRALAAAARVEIATRSLWDVRVPVMAAGRLESGLRSLPAAAAAGIDVEETLWGGSHAVLLVTTPSPDPVALEALISELTQGAAVPSPAGERTVESRAHPLRAR